MRKQKLKNTSEESPLLNMLGRILVMVMGLLIVEYLIPGFRLESLGVAIIAAIVIGAINTFIRPVIQILALPFTLVTLGIAAFIINVLLLMFAALIVPGFEIDGFLTAAISSILLSLINAFLHKISN